MDDNIRERLRGAEPKVSQASRLCCPPITPLMFNFKFRAICGQVEYRPKRTRRRSLIAAKEFCTEGHKDLKELRFPWRPACTKSLCDLRGLLCRFRSEAPGALSFAKENGFPVRGPDEALAELCVADAKSS